MASIASWGTPPVALEYLLLVIDKLVGWTCSWELASIASWGTPPVALAYLLLVVEKLVS